MTAHVLFELIDPDRPATISRPIVTDLLRSELGFGGLVFSDDLEMKAVADTYGVARAACLAIEAGCDQVLICEHEDLVFEAHAALLQRAEQEPRFAERLREAADRSRQLRLARAPQLDHIAVAPARVERRLAAQDASAIEALIQRSRGGVAPV
jgi:beta-N-acetylhexosaminidase